MNLLIITMLCVFSSAEMRLTPKQQATVLHEAQTSYDSGVSLQSADPVAAKESFRRSANRFQVLVNDGVVNGRLWFNLGNANVQAGEIGKAIAAYRSAQHYIPSDGRLQANLMHARTLVDNPIIGTTKRTFLDRLTFWHYTLPTSVRLGFGMMCWFAFWGLVGVRIFKGIPGFKSALCFLGFFSIVLSVSVGLDIATQHLQHGVIVNDEVIVRKGNGVNYAPLFKEPIHEGVEFEIIEQRPEWLHILLPNGSKGWVEESSALLV
jgi:hypothetical protein